MKIRRRVAERALTDALSFLRSGGGDVAIFDATNVTLERRHMIHQRVTEEAGYLCLFIESFCDDEARISYVVAAAAAAAGRC